MFDIVMYRVHAVDGVFGAAIIAPETERPAGVIMVPLVRVETPDAVEVIAGSIAGVEDRIDVLAKRGDLLSDASGCLRDALRDLNAALRE